jgi:hypothetical protein
MKKILPLAVLVVIVAAVAYYFSSTVNPTATSIASQTAFSIDDTASIGKIFIADLKGNKALLTRQEDNTWLINEKYRAREDAIETLLKTFKNVYIQRPVSKGAQTEVNKLLAGAHKKVEIYDLEGEWIKTWYVGDATMDKKGTYMLLETPEWGRAAAPYILDMRGFIGMLNTRFFTNENEWRSVGLLKYDELTINEINVTYPGSEEQGFRITYGGGNDIKLFYPGDNNPIPQFDTSLVKDYLLNFKLASFENYRTGLTAMQIDSVLNSRPYQIIEIQDRKGTEIIKLWPKKAAPSPEFENDSTRSEVDLERVYAVSSAGELALAQRLTWDKFRAPIQAFLGEKRR